MSLFRSLLLMVAVSSNAYSFTLVDPLITGGWNTTELTFQVNEGSCTALGISASDLNSAIDEAMDLWNSVPTSNLKMVRGQVTTSTTNSNPPTIYCSTTLPDSSIAGVGQVASVSGGRPATGSLALNGLSTAAAYFNKIGATERIVVVAHEIGHVLGLGHSSSDSALMYYQVSSKEAARLSQDDIDGITWLHPRKEFSDGVFGCATTQVGQIPPGPTNGMLSFLFSMAMIASFIAFMRPRWSRRS